ASGDSELRGDAAEPGHPPAPCDLVRAEDAAETDEQPVAAAGDAVHVRDIRDAALERARVAVVERQVERRNRVEAERAAEVGIVSPAPRLCELTVPGEPGEEVRI